MWVVAAVIGSIRVLEISREFQNDSSEIDKDDDSNDAYEGKDSEGCESRRIPTPTGGDRENQRSAAIGASLRLILATVGIQVG